MNINYIRNKIRNDSKYWLEYDYFINSSDVELFTVDESPCILNCSESYSMVATYNRVMLSDLEHYLYEKLGECKDILINFNVNLNLNVDEEINYLESNQYRFHSCYDTYVFKREPELKIDNLTNDNVLELTSNNINFYKNEYCNERIQYRPSLKQLIDIFVRKKRGHIIAYIKDNYILGYLSYINIFEDVNDVDYIYVAENYRQMGIGTALGEYYAARSIDDNKYALWSNANEVSSKTAVKAGFERCCRHMSFYKK